MDPPEESKESNDENPSMENGVVEGERAAGEPEPAAVAIQAEDDAGDGDDAPPPPPPDDENPEEDNEAENEENPMAHLPDYVVKRVEALQGLQHQRDEIMEMYLAERAALEQKFAAMVQPLYEERSKIVRGEKDDEIPAPEPTEGDNASPPLVGIPQFWVCTMNQNDVIGECITEDDVDCLERLKDITCVDRPDGKGFTLMFHFDANDYFYNAVLTKTYEVPNLLLSDEPLLKNVEGCAIKWKEGRALTYRMVKKKQRGKGKNAGQVRTVKKKEEIDSFFRWFEPPPMPSLDSIDEEEAERLEEFFDGDYEIAQAFRSHVIPRAVQWFTGQAEEERLLEALYEADLEDDED